MKKDAQFALEQEIAKTKALKALEPKTEQSVEDKNADGSDKTETVDEP